VQLLGATTSKSQTHARYDFFLCTFDHAQNDFFYCTGGSIAHTVSTVYTYVGTIAKTTVAEESECKPNGQKNRILWNTHSWMGLKAVSPTDLCARRQMLPYYYYGCSAMLPGRPSHACMDHSHFFLNQTQTSFDFSNYYYLTPA
jgi:hypothetical protein